MTGWLSLLPIDGDNTPKLIYAGDTIKYRIQVIDEDKLPFTHDITGARFELMDIIDGVPTPLADPIVKEIGTGINIIPTAIIEVILLPVDTTDLPEAVYLAVLKAMSTDFGELTIARRLRLEKQLAPML